VWLELVHAAGTEARPTSEGDAPEPAGERFKARSAHQRPRTEVTRSPAITSSQTTAQTSKLIAA
jgi:hypothetical protein